MKKISDLTFVMVIVLSSAFSALLINTSTPYIPELGDLQKIYPDKCWASSELAERWGCESLYDTQYGYDNLHWEDNSNRCSLAELKFYFNEEVFVEFVVFKNLDDEVLFNRNYKIKTAWVTYNNEDIVSNILELKNEQYSQWLDINENLTSITFQVVSAYPGVEFNGASPFEECSLQEVTFYGRKSV